MNHIPMPVVAYCHLPYSARKLEQMAFFYTRV